MRGREREWMHDRGDKEREKGGKKLVETREARKLGGGGGREEKGTVFMLTSEVVQMSQAPENVTASGRKGIRET